jgi:hypothetical protein
MTEYEDRRLYLNKKERSLWHCNPSETIASFKWAS